MTVFCPVCGLPGTSERCLSCSAPLSYAAHGEVPVDFLDTSKAEIAVTCRCGATSRHTVRCSLRVPRGHSVPRPWRHSLVVCPACGTEERLLQPVVVHVPGEHRVILRLPEGYRTRLLTVLSWWYATLARSRRPSLPAYLTQPEVEYILPESHGRRSAKGAAPRRDESSLPLPAPGPAIEIPEPTPPQADPGDETHISRHKAPPPDADHESTRPGSAPVAVVRRKRSLSRATGEAPSAEGWQADQEQPTGEYTRPAAGTPVAEEPREAPEPLSGHTTSPEEPIGAFLAGQDIEEVEDFEEVEDVEVVEELDAEELSLTGELQAATAREVDHPSEEDSPPPTPRETADRPVDALPLKGDVPPLPVIPPKVELPPVDQAGATTPGEDEQDAAATVEPPVVAMEESGEPEGAPPPQPDEEAAEATVPGAERPDLQAEPAAETPEEETPSKPGIESTRTLRSPMGPEGEDGGDELPEPTERTTKAFGESPSPVLISVPQEAPGRTTEEWHPSQLRLDKPEAAPVPPALSDDVPTIPPVDDSSSADEPAVLPPEPDEPMTDEDGLFFSETELDNALGDSLSETSPSAESLSQVVEFIERDLEEVVARDVTSSRELQDTLVLTSSSSSDVIEVPSAFDRPPAEDDRPGDTGAAAGGRGSGQIGFRD